MSNFFDNLKSFLIEEKRNHESLDVVGYYETMKQHENNMGTMIDDLENNIQKYYFNFQENDNGYYTDGDIEVYPVNFEKTNYHYIIHLVHDERMWGYCECFPSDEGYDPIHRCCGVGCDHTFPAISIDKVENVCNFSFEGYEKDLWELGKKWADIFKDYENEKIKNQIKNEIDNIKRSEERIALLNAKLNEGKE